MQRNVTSFPDLQNLPLSRPGTEPCNKWHIGVDEVGRGPLFGRVYAAAVILPKTGFDTTKVKDSKKYTSEKKIQEANDYVLKNAVAYGIGWRDEKRIDEINILQATQEAMHDAIQQCIQLLQENDANISDINTLKPQITNDEVKIMVDGTYFRSYPDVEHECFVQGDSRFPCIAAASIIAKVARDAYIRELCETNLDLVNKYDLLNNKGYGTVKHRQGILQHGYTDGHRKSFKLKEKHD